MEDGLQHRPNVGDGTSDGKSSQHCTTIPPTPPPRLDPNADSKIPALETVYKERSDEPLTLSGPQWDINSVSALATLHMFATALEKLAEATGDVPPTPPISRPTTPMRDRAPSETTIPAITIGSPEAHPHEAIRVIGEDAEDHFIQHTAIARRFFSKVPPQFTLTEYLDRLHRFCPHSPGVYLAAASYCLRLCVTDYMVPATKRTIHRLALSAIRIAAKALEDNKWTQERVSKVGGIGLTQLLNLEISLSFLMDFELWVDETGLARGMFLLQQAGEHKAGAHEKLSNFKLRLPPRRRGKPASKAA